MSRLEWHSPCISGCREDTHIEKNGNTPRQKSVELKIGPSIEICNAGSFKFECECRFSRSAVFLAYVPSMSSSTSRSCCINLSKDIASEDHAFFVKLLLRAGVRSRDIRVIDIQGRRGTCKVTLASTAARDTLLSRGLSAQGKILELLPGDGTAETVHVFGVPEDMALWAIASSLSRFGTLLGPTKNEKKTVEGCTFSTGIVYYTMVPTIAVPSSITVGRYKLRVWHKGQSPRAGSVAPPATWRGIAGRSRSRAPSPVRELQRQQASLDHPKNHLGRDRRTKKWQRYQHQQNSNKKAV